MSNQTIPSSIERDVRQILDEVVKTEISGVASDTDLFHSEIIDSFNMIELIEHLEERFLIGIVMEDLTVQNFGTINAISNTVQNYLDRASAA